MRLLVVSNHQSSLVPHTSQVPDCEENEKLDRWHEHVEKSYLVDKAAYVQEPGRGEVVVDTPCVQIVRVFVEEKSSAAVPGGQELRQDVGGEVLHDHGVKDELGGLGTRADIGEASHRDKEHPHE